MPKNFRSIINNISNNNNKKIKEQYNSRSPLMNNHPYVNKNINEIKQYPTIIIANEFFDAFPIKQFFKINTKWHEQCISFKNNTKRSIV